MLRITIELLPLGDETRKQTLGTADIWNDLSGTRTRGNYQFRLSGKTKKFSRSGEIKDFARKQKNAWYLVKEMLELL